MGQRTGRCHDPETMNRPTDTLQDDLQGELRELLCLAALGDHVRWVLTEDDGSLAGWLAEAIPEWRGLADQVAEHLWTLGVPPDGRVQALIKDPSVNWVRNGWLRRDEAEALLVGRVRRAASWARLRRLHATDPEVINLLDAICTALEGRPCPPAPSTLSSR
jgi:hypothetical protein